MQYRPARVTKIGGVDERLYEKQILARLSILSERLLKLEQSQAVLIERLRPKSVWERIKEWLGL